MSTTGEPHAQALADNVQREVERAALRKVRRLTDQLEGEERNDRRIERLALRIGLGLIAGVLLLIVAGSYLVRPAANVGKIELPAKTAPAAKP